VNRVPVQAHGKGDHGRLQIQMPQPLLPHLLYVPLQRLKPDYVYVPQICQEKKVGNLLSQITDGFQVTEQLYR
jgi:hypothetical protein